MKLFIVALFLGVGVAKKAIIFEKAELVRNNDDYGTSSVVGEKYNRTTFIMNARVNITKKEWPLDALMHLAIYKYSDNVYKKTALQYEKPFCEFIKKDKYYYFGNKYLKDKIVLADTCPVKGYYGVFDADPNKMLENIVNFFPTWRCKAIFMIHRNNNVLLNIEFYFRVIENM